MVLVIRCDYCGSNLELQELDNKTSYREEFVTEGCEAFECPGKPEDLASKILGGVPDYLKTPERIAYEEVFGDVEMPEGLYTLEEVEEDGE